MGADVDEAREGRSSPATIDPSPASSRRDARWSDYAIALAWVACATVARRALDPVLGDSYPFSTYFGAVAVVAWFGRVGPSLVALGASTLVTLYAFLPPRSSLAVTDLEVLVGLGLFLVIGLVMVAMGYWLQEARRRVERLLEEARVRELELRQVANVEREHRERLRTTLACIGDAVITTDAAGRVTNLNPVAEALTGWTNAEAAGVPLSQVFHIVNESTRLPVENPALRALKEGVVVGLANHTVLVSRDGAERPIDDSAAPIRLADGEVTGAVLVFRDITQRHRVETENRDARRQLVSTLESVTDGFVRYDRDWRIVFVNAEAERMHGLARSKMLGKTPWELSPHVVGTKFETELRRALVEGVTVEFEHFDEPLGRWYSLKGYPTPDGGLTTFIRDITEHKRFEQRLLESEALYRAIGESIDFGVWVCDAEGRNTYTSDSFLRLVGITQQQCSDFGWADVLHPDDAEATIAAWKECVRTQGTWDRQHRFKGVDGQWHHALARGVLRKDAEGHVLGWAGINLDITRLVQTEREVARLAAESERQRRLYETVLTNTPDFVYVFSLDHRVLYANDALIRMWGRGHDGAIGKTFLEIGYEPWHAEMHDREIDQVRATRKPVRGEVPFNGTNGRRLYDYIFVPVLGADGEVEAVAGTTRDVTERREAERAVRAGEARLQTALTAARMVAWEWTPADRKLRVSKNAAELFGLPAGVDLTVIDEGLALVHPDDRAAYQATFQKAIEERGSYLVRYRLIRPNDGRVIWIEERGNTVFEDNGGGVLLYGVAMDVTERERAERELTRLAGEAERDRRLLDTALSNTADFNFIFELDGTFAYANRSLLELWGRTSAEAIGKSMAELGYPHEVETQLLDDLRRVIQTGKAAVGETSYSSPAGVTGYYEYALAPVFDAAGSVVQVVGSARDIVERKRTEEELRRLAAELGEAHRRKDEFLATLAHELRNPLAPIRNGLQLIRTADPGGTVEQARVMMDRQLTHLIRLVDDLLDVSRLTSGKLELRKSAVELRAVIDAAVETSRLSIDRAGHELVVDVPAEPIVLDADATRIAQVVSNLLNNSAKYTCRGGLIRLEARREGGTAVITVRDNGIGIPGHMLGRVFEMFVQVDRSLEKTTGGLGIGLSLVKGLVEMHGGSIEARSDGEGGGSEFVLRLPLVIARDGAERSDDERDRKLVPAGSRRILVVDDNEDSADSLAMLLESLGNDVRKAYDGEAGVAVAADFRPDVVLMDIAMPKLNGYDACRRIRTQPWGREMVLVALTGWGQDDDRRKSSGAGFDHHLVKPVEAAALMKLLAEA